MNLGLVFFVLIALLIAARAGASYLIEYQWWKEMDQVETWVSQLLYAVLPTVAVGLLAFVVFWIAHARGLKSGGTGLGQYPTYAKLSTAGLLLLGFLVALMTVDTWGVVRYFGSASAAGDSAWKDPAFEKPLSFYFFELPFYQTLLRMALAITLIAALIRWLAGRFFQLRDRFGRREFDQPIDLSELDLGGSLDSRFLRLAVAAFLLALAARFYLDRYDLLLAEHGFMKGMDWTGENVELPLLWVSVVVAAAGAILALAGRFKWILLLALLIPLKAIVPRIVSAAYVRPNEISIQGPYIERHIAATRAAWGIDRKNMSERQVPFKAEAPFDARKNKALLDNVRLWDWRPFHDTVSQLQPIRPYVYSDSDVDRYVIDGQLRQVLLAPREIELTQLGDARNRWINPHFVFTHGYGIVLAEANRITANGLPVLFVQDAPPKVNTKSLKLTRPEIYFGEQVHDPVFVRTAQPEFNYPSGSEDITTRYEGKGGFPIASLPLRIAAALSEGDWNILLTTYLTGESRMMIHRRLEDRLGRLAPFLSWDEDPYLVLSDEGRLVWILDGYTTSRAHPYSRDVRSDRYGRVNYMRNSVKATVDAYDGTTVLYVFEDQDPLLAAYRNLFPKLFQPASAMPADLRRHARYPENLFEHQAEIYRLFHMRDPDSFYNRADQWDIANHGGGQQPRPMQPSYVLATLPGESQPEFLVMIPFTPRNKQNLIGMMVARCDGDNLGELLFLPMGREEIIPGPMQIEARINQDQNISKDLTLWNQQGSQVLRGQMLVLPIENTILYVAPIYLQAAQARMPQLKKVALGMGNLLAYQDTYEQALADLLSQLGLAPPPQVSQAAPGTPPPAAGPAPAAGMSSADPRVEAIRGHMRRYRELQSQGKWSEAGRELEAIDALLRR